MAPSNTEGAMKILSIANSPARIIGGLCEVVVAIVRALYTLFGVSLGPVLIRTLRSLALCPLYC